MADSTNPLGAWFSRVDETKDAFIERTGISRASLFHVLADLDLDYSVRTLARIEEGTGGEVTVRMLLDWLNRAKS